ncbi:MAG: TIGR03905 family TSCPD domain-containing protein [Lachnospiraceae bacterium]|nr:TIGR03905 family TSCPD domain-containing protein [Lachnospiraceae bacterium]
MQYKTSGTCSQMIDFEVEGDVITSVAFTGGCNGNLKGIAALVSGMKVDDAITKLKGIKCGHKNTSCPDQLACALEKFKADEYTIS